MTRQGVIVNDSGMLAHLLNVYFNSTIQTQTDRQTDRQTDTDTDTHT